MHRVLSAVLSSLTDGTSGVRSHRRRPCPAHTLCSGSPCLPTSERRAGTITFLPCVGCYRLRLRRPRHRPRSSCSTRCLPSRPPRTSTPRLTAGLGNVPTRPHGTGRSLIRALGHDAIRGRACRRGQPTGSFATPTSPRATCSCGWTWTRRAQSGGHLSQSPGRWASILAFRRGIQGSMRSSTSFGWSTPPPASDGSGRRAWAGGTSRKLAPQSMHTNRCTVARTRMPDRNM